MRGQDRKQRDVVGAITTWRKRWGMVLMAIVVASLGFAPQAFAQLPFVMDGAVDSGITARVDPHANTKELGPLNGNSTKISVINSAEPPMLEFTNPNGQVDLGLAYLTTRKAADGKQWLYFAWNRPDSNSGSGFISIEFQQSGLPNGCSYVGVDFTSKTDPETAALIAGCNPWRNRQDGDFIILWDQQGNTLDAVRDIKKRVFTCTGAAVPYTCTLGGIEDFGTVVAAISGDRFVGEMAINLTDDVFDPAAGCQTFANVLPGTVTGNSDTADYKDTIFAAFEPITNCGVLKVTKKLVAPDGTTPIADANALFGYKVDRVGSTALRFATDAAAHPLDGDPDFAQFSIVRPNAATGAPGIKGDETQVHTDLIVGTDYRLVEDVIALNYQKLSIICTDGAGAHDVTASGTFKIEAPDGVQFTDCVITNKFIKTTPTIVTGQSVTLFDSMSMTGINPGAADKATTVVFKLFSDNACTAQVGTSKTADLTYAADNKSASANTFSSGIAATVVAGVETTFYWQVFYAGDALNNPRTTACGDETTKVTINK